MYNVSCNVWCCIMLFDECNECDSLNIHDVLVVSYLFSLFSSLFLFLVSLLIYFLYFQFLSSTWYFMVCLFMHTCIMMDDFHILQSRKWWMSLKYWLGRPKGRESTPSGSFWRQSFLRIWWTNQTIYFHLLIMWMSTQTSWCPSLVYWEYSWTFFFPLSL